MREAASGVLVPLALANLPVVHSNISILNHRVHLFFGILIVFVFLGLGGQIVQYLLAILFVLGK